MFVSVGSAVRHTCDCVCSACIVYVRHEYSFFSMYSACSVCNVYVQRISNASVNSVCVCIFYALVYVQHIFVFKMLLNIQHVYCIVHV